MKLKPKIQISPPFKMFAFVLAIGIPVWIATNINAGLILPPSCQGIQCASDKAIEFTGERIEAIGKPQVVIPQEISGLKFFFTRQSEDKHSLKSFYLLSMLFFDYAYFVVLGCTFVFGATESAKNFCSDFSRR